MTYVVSGLGRSSCVIRSFFNIFRTGTRTRTSRTSRICLIRHVAGSVVFCGRKMTEANIRSALEVERLRIEDRVAEIAFLIS